jgi:predicted Fe-Mo cluster-binding NifX family protein
MIVCLPVTEGGQVGQGWGRADRVAIADVGESGVDRWQEFDVGWGQTHDAAGEGQHHGRIARFLIDHRVTCVVAGHMGPPMQQMLGQMGITVRVGVSGEARAVAGAVAVVGGRTGRPGEGW